MLAMLAMLAALSLVGGSVILPPIRKGQNSVSKEITMQRSRFVLAFFMLGLLTPVAARGADLPPTLKVAQQELQLNGQGVREKYFLDLYKAGLYLSQPNQPAQTIVAADQWMAIRVVITSKMVSQQKMIASLQEGFQNATGGKVEPIQAQIDQFRQCFADPISSGDTFDLVYAPGHGTVVLKNGKQKGAIAGLPFKQALFGIWLGQRPADVGLKVALLGSSARQ